MQNGNGNGDGDGELRQRVKQIHRLYLYLVKEMGKLPEGGDYAQTMLGLDPERFYLLSSLKPDTLELLANSKVMLFGPMARASDINSFAKLCEKGSKERAASLLAAGISADQKGEGEQ